MKKILLLLTFLLNLSHADEYISLHNGTFLSTILNSSIFMSNQRLSSNYTVYIDRHSAKSPTTGKPYYPQGWNKFKIYIPAGLEYITTNLVTQPNSPLRVHTKFRADQNNIVDHYNPSGTTFYEATNQLSTEMIMLNTGQLYYPNVQTAGWLYFDIVEDRANSYAENTYSGNVTLYINIRMIKNNDTLFSNWLNNTYFLTSMGDPSSLIQTMETIDVTTPDTSTQKTISLDYGGSLYDGTPISSASSSSISSTASTSSATSVSSSISSTTSSLSNSSSLNPCGAGYYVSPDTGGCVPIGGVASSSFSSSSSLPYCDTLSSSSSGGSILPMAVVCIIRPTSSASSVSSNPCGAGYYQSPDTGGCVPISIGGTSSSSSSSSSSSVVTQDASTTLQAGWNLISIPIATNEEIDVNTTLDGKATIAYKFDANTTSIWEKWVPGVAMKLKNGEGLFAGVPSSYGAPSLNFSVTADTNNTTSFENSSYTLKTWYLLGFGYDITVESIKTKYPNSVIFTMENGAYIRQDVNATTIKKGQGFWFKRYE